MPSYQNWFISTNHSIFIVHFEVYGHTELFHFEYNKSINLCSACSKNKSSQNDDVIRKREKPSFFNAKMLISLIYTEC